MYNIWAWFDDNSDALQGLGAIGTFFAVAFAAWQVTEASAQRDVSDSFALTKEFDALLRIWSESEGNDKRKPLANFLVACEVAAMGINRNRFSRMTRYLVSHHICDGLCLVCSEAQSPKSISELMSDSEVFRELRLFLLERYSLMKRKADRAPVYSCFFAGSRGAILWEDCAGAAILRRTRAVALRLGLA